MDPRYYSLTILGLFALICVMSPTFGSTVAPGLAVYFLAKAILSFVTIVNRLL